MIRVVLVLFTSLFLTLSTFAQQQNCDPDTREASATTNSDNAPFKLLQNFPNPARDMTNIKVQVNCPGNFTLRIYDMVGNLVYLHEEHMQTGLYSMPVETVNFPEGVYFYVMKRDSFSQTMKLVISRRQ